MSSLSGSILFFTAIIFSGCNGAEKVELLSDDESKLNFVSPAFYCAPRIWPASIHGQWSARGIFMYSGVLKIKRDGSFTFFENGCLGGRYSEGTWRGFGDVFVLQSQVKTKEASWHQDSGYRYFNNEQLSLVGDTLYASGSKFVMEEQY